jgi:hypothetical protein
MTKIYKIIKDRNVVYIGKTKQSLAARFKQHEKQKLFDDTYFIELIEIVEDDKAKEREDMWIRMYNTRVEGLNKRFESKKKNTTYSTSKLINAEATAKAIIKNMKKK